MKTDYSSIIGDRYLYDVDKLKKLVDEEAGSKFPVRKVSGAKVKDILSQCLLGSE